MIQRSYEQWLVSNGDSGPRGAQSTLNPPQAGRSAPLTSEFKRPDENIVRMLQTVIEGRCLVVEELDEVIGYFEQQRNAMAKSQGLTQASKSLTSGLYNVLCTVIIKVKVWTLVVALLSQNPTLEALKEWHTL